MNRFSSESEFILMRSPKRAPPVRFLVGSVARSAIFIPGLSRWILSIISSVRLDFPAPPVPVSPTTGHDSSSERERTLSRAAENTSSSPFSASVSSLETAPWSSAVTGPDRDSKRAESSSSAFDALCMASWTIPTSPSSRPSSGE